MPEPIAATIYATQLAALLEGFPLWEPNPHDEPAVDIADVGYIKNGAWVRLFNASRPVNDASNKYGIPKGYKSLNVGAIQGRERLPANTPMHSDGVLQLGAQAAMSGGPFAPAGVAFNFECSREEGAVLLLGDDAVRRDALQSYAFVQYIRENHTTWLEFANDVHERGIALDDLVLVTGCDKTSAWACAAFSARSSQASVNVSVGLPSMVQAGVSLSWAWKNCSSVATRSGPWRPVSSVVFPIQAPHPSSGKPAHVGDEDGDVTMAEAQCHPPATSSHSIRDQCVFLRGYKMCDRRTLRRLWKKTKYDGFSYVSHSNNKGNPNVGSYRSHDPPSGPSGDPSSGGSHWPPPRGDRGSESGSSGPSDSNSDFGGQRSSPSSSSESTDSLNSESFETDEDLDLWQSDWGKKLMPLDLILVYILEHSNAELALAHHDDLIVVFQDVKAGIDFESLISKVSPKIYVDEHQVGMLETTYRCSLSKNAHVQTNTRQQSSKKDIMLDNGQRVSAFQSSPLSFQPRDTNVGRLDISRAPLRRANLLQQPQSAEFTHTLQNSTSATLSYRRYAVGPGTPSLYNSALPRMLPDPAHDANLVKTRNSMTFRCPVPGCGQTFERRFSLKGHLRSHNTEPSYVCKWPGCEKGFARQHDCKRHEALHFNIPRPYTCARCKKTFTRMDALNRHLRSEGGADCARHEQPLQDLQQQQHHDVRKNPNNELDTGSISPEIESPIQAW